MRSWYDRGSYSWTYDPWTSHFFFFNSLNGSVFRTLASYIYLVIYVFRSWRVPYRVLIAIIAKFVRIIISKTLILTKDDQCYSPKPKPQAQGRDCHFTPILV